MARPQSTDHALKRSEILDYAAQCFAQRGYAAASMNDIATACGTSKARLYHYYASKDAMLFDLLDAYTEQLQDIARPYIQTPHKTARTARTQLHVLIREFLAAYEHSTTRHIALTSDVQFLPPASRKRIVHRQRELIHVFSALIAQAYPRLPPTQLMPRTMMLFGMMNWTFTWLKPTAKPANKKQTERISYAQFAELVIATLEHGFTS
jgi:AcrR family transcriptional regulator